MELYAALIFTAAALSISAILHLIRWDGRLGARGAFGHDDVASLVRNGYRRKEI